MEKIIDISKLTFKYSETPVFDNFDMIIFNQDTTIIGTSSSGKTTLAKILSGIYLSDSIRIYNLTLNKKNIEKIRKNLAVVNNEYNFVAETVADEIAFGMENLRVSNKRMRDEIIYLGEYFNLSEKMGFDLDSLSKSDQTVVKIISFIVMNPQMIVFDDVLTHVNREMQLKIIKLLKEKNIRFINITTEIEEVLYADYLIVLDKGKIIIEGKTNSVLSEEKILKRFGFNLPFAVDLSRQLQVYNLLNKTYYNIDKIVEELWK